MTASEQPCGYGATPCGATPTRLFLVGYRCRSHTPAVIAGRQDVWPDPERTLETVRARAGRAFTFRASDTALIDQRARQSGKRANAQQRAGARD